MMRLRLLGLGAATAAGLMLATATQAAPAFDPALSAADAADVTRVQYYGGRPYYSYAPNYAYGYGYGESPQHYLYRQDHAAYRQAHRAYRAERFWRYGY